MKICKVHLTKNILFYWINNNNLQSVTSFYWQHWLRSTNSHPLFVMFMEREREIYSLIFILAFKAGLNLILKLTMWYLLWYDSFFYALYIEISSLKKKIPQETSRRWVFLSSSLKWCGPTHLVGAKEKKRPWIPLSHQRYTHQIHCVPPRAKFTYLLKVFFIKLRFTFTWKKGHSIRAKYIAYHLI